MENLIERAYILETTSILQPESFPGELIDFASSEIIHEPDNTRSIAYVRRKAIEEVEKKYLRELMDENRGKIKKSAEIAGISTRQLHKLLTKYRIIKEDFKNIPEKRNTLH
jgi:DNA-binding NtrC family response regulator